MFQFKKHSSEVGPAAWQAEAKEKRVRAASEAMASEIQRMEEQQEMLKKAGTTGAELAVSCWGSLCRVLACYQVLRLWRCFDDSVHL